MPGLLDREPRRTDEVAAVMDELRGGGTGPRGAAAVRARAARRRYGPARRGGGTGPRGAAAVR
ncbi:hypothetical protein [Streptomyces sp. Tu6071]|uniref:hypothetical protein n=1 Tax=Streptomyces sp. Tu6071 TaxID=355249 RepID=UPI0005B8ED0E|nr:hypothetical protein [Streptomyces sp. Tu6071]